MFYIIFKSFMVSSHSIYIFYVRVDTFATMLEEQHSTDGRYFKEFATRLDKLETITESMKKTFEEINARGSKSTQM